MSAKVIVHGWTKIILAELLSWTWVQPMYVLLLFLVRITVVLVLGCKDVATCSQLDDLCFHHASCTHALSTQMASAGMVALMSKKGVP